MVRVWSPQTLVTVAVIGEDVFDGGVFSVAFSHKVVLLYATTTPYYCTTIVRY